LVLRAREDGEPREHVADPGAAKPAFIDTERCKRTLVETDRELARAGAG